MNVSCDKCGKRYVISDDKVAGKSSVKIRCKQCQNLITVAVGGGAAAPAAQPAQAAQPAPRSSSSGIVPAPRSPWEDEATRAMPPLDASAQWFAMVRGKQEGPWDANALSQKAAAGEITLRTYLWKSGMGDWKRAADLPELSAVFAGTPQRPPSEASMTVRPPPPPRTATKQQHAVQRDVALANELPAPGLTNRPTAQSGAGAVVAKSSTQAPLNDLFGDVSGLNDLPKDRSKESPVAESPSAESPQPESNSAPVDPFAALSAGDGKEAPPPGEATRFFIAQAGVNKRNPPWKIALAIMAFIGGPIALLYILNTFEIVKLPTVTTTNDKGEEVQESFFSAGGVGGLKDLLTGDAKKRKEEAERQRLEKEKLAKAKLVAANTGPKKDPKDDEPEVVKPKEQDPSLVDFYGKDDRRQVGPKVRKDPGEEGNSGAVNTSGLSQEAIAKVVADKGKAFQTCIDNALRRQPNLAVGKLEVVLQVGPSGAVKSASLNPKKHEMTEWGQCMMSTGKRIVFPSSDSETEVQLPFTVGVAVAP
ncbi:MAG: GYF domain-containing protein [Myxococcaceae bacterium]